jgi:hypothetical protein
LPPKSCINVCTGGAASALGARNDGSPWLSPHCFCKQRSSLQNYLHLSRRPSSSISRCVALVRTEVSQERIACIIRVERISELGTMLTVTSILNTLHIASGSSQCSSLLVTAYLISGSLILSTFMMEAISSTETSVLTRDTRRHNPEDDILLSHRIQDPQILLLRLSSKKIQCQTIKMVTCTGNRPILSRLFSALFSAMEDANIKLPLHTEVRWLSQGRMLARFYELRGEIIICFYVSSHETMQIKLSSYRTSLKS